jgi:hypothetical protein
VDLAAFYLRSCEIAVSYDRIRPTTYLRTNFLVGFVLASDRRHDKPGLESVCLVGHPVCKVALVSASDGCHGGHDLCKLGLVSVSDDGHLACRNDR